MAHTLCPYAQVKTRNTFQILVRKICKSTGCQMTWMLESGFIAHFNLPSFSLRLTSVWCAVSTFSPHRSVFLSCSSLAPYYPTSSTSTNCFSFKDSWIDACLLLLSNCSQPLFCCYFYFTHRRETSVPVRLLFQNIWNVFKYFNWCNKS